MTNLITKRDELRRQYREHPTKILEIRGKLLNWAIAKAKKKSFVTTAEEIFGVNKLVLDKVSKKV